MNMDNAWIEPDGTVHEVKYMGHNEFASDLLKKEMNDDEWDHHCDSHNYPYEILHERGWIRLMTWRSRKTRALGNCTTLLHTMTDTMDPSTTAKQRSVLRNWCKINKFKYKDLFLND